MSKTKTIDCGDWHLGWGFGGQDKVGKLTKIGPNRFLWKGHSEGRHGRKWNHGAFVEFSVIDGEVNVIGSEGGFPRRHMLLSCVAQLETTG